MSHEDSQSKAGGTTAYYGTFPGAPSYTQGQPAIGFPQPIPPPGSSAPSAPPYYPHGYQAVQGYAVVEGTPVPARHPRLPCCGCGLGWFLFIIGFFLAGIPWYVGAIILIFGRQIDYREKPGFITCTIAAILALFVVIFGVSEGTHSWWWRRH